MAVLFVGNACLCILSNLIIISIPDVQYLLAKFASICGATVSKFWKPNVTHVIAATDVKGACSRTLKVLKAILNGRWILKTECELHLCLLLLHTFK